MTDKLHIELTFSLSNSEKRLAGSLSYCLMLNEVFAFLLMKSFIQLANQFIYEVNFCMVGTNTVELQANTGFLKHDSECATCGSATLCNSGWF